MIELGEKRVLVNTLLGNSDPMVVRRMQVRERKRRPRRKRVDRKKKKRRKRKGGGHALSF